MDYKVIWDDEAIEELSRIVQYIAADNPSAARKMGLAILDNVKRLGSFPEIGRVFSRLNRSDVREISVRPYRIIYHCQNAARCVRILKIWHGARQDPEIK